MLEKTPPLTTPETLPNTSSPYEKMSKLDLVEERRKQEEEKRSLEAMLVALSKDMEEGEKVGDFTKVFTLQKVKGSTQKNLDRTNQLLTEIEQKLNAFKHHKEVVKVVEDTWPTDRYDSRPERGSIR